MDGPDATKVIRELGYTGPIIGCTGNTLDIDLLRFKESGCDRVIGKPFLPELFHQFMIELKGGTVTATAAATSPPPTNPNPLDPVLWI
jgi:CheY-like chemotaxis protein